MKRSQFHRVLLLVVALASVNCSSGKKIELVLSVDIAHSYTGEEVDKAKVLERIAATITNRLAFYTQEAPGLSISSIDGKMTATFNSSVVDEKEIIKFVEQRGMIEFREALSNENAFPIFDSVNRMLGRSARIEGSGPNSDVRPTVSSKTKDSTMSASDRRDRLAAENPVFIILKPAMTSSQQLVDGAVVGYTVASDSNKMRSLLFEPEGCEFVRTTVSLVFRLSQESSELAEMYFLKKKVAYLGILNSSDVLTAEAIIDSISKNSAVSIKMSKLAIDRLQLLAETRYHRFLAILCDGEVLSCPRITSQVTSGNVIVSNNYDNEAAQKLAVMINSGPLCAPVKVERCEIKN